MNTNRLRQYLTDINKYLGWLAYELRQSGIDAEIDIQNIHYALNRCIQPKLDEYDRKQKNENK